MLIGLKNRSSLLSAATDKSKICSFEEAKANLSKGPLKSGVSKLYEKNVMASKTAILLGVRRTNSLKMD